MKQSHIKNINIANVFTYIAVGKNVTRAQIIRDCKLSPSTVTDITQGLVQNRFVRSGSILENVGAGRPSEQLSCNRDSYAVLVIEIKSNSLCVRLNDLEGTPTFEKKMQFMSGFLVTHILEIYTELKNELLKQVRLIGVCVIVPAIINDEEKTIYSTILNERETKNIIGQLEDIFREIPVLFLNDSACLAYAEAHSNFEKFGDSTSFIFLNMAEGLGGSFINKGKLMSGSSGNGTQFGHVSIDHHGPRCVCGGRGCLECLMGQKALISKVQEARPDFFLDLMPEEHYKKIIETYRSGDPWFKNLLSETAYFLALGIANILSIYKTDLVILGGEGRFLGEDFLNEITHCLRTSAHRFFLDKARIRYSELNESASFFGAQLYFFKHHMNFSSLK